MILFNDLIMPFLFGEFGDFGRCDSDEGSFRVVVSVVEISLGLLTA